MILHLLKNKDDSYPMEVIRKQVEASHEVVVILMQQAGGLTRINTGALVFVLEEDGASSSHSKMGYNTLLDYIFRADTVVTW